MGEVVSLTDVLESCVEIDEIKVAIQQAQGDDIYSAEFAETAGLVLGKDSLGLVEAFHRSASGIQKDATRAALAVCRVRAARSALADLLSEGARFGVNVANDELSCTADSLRQSVLFTQAEIYYLKEPSILESMLVRFVNSEFEATEIRELIELTENLTPDGLG